MTERELPGELIREFREELGLSQRDFARETGGAKPNGAMRRWKTQRVSDLEQGRVKEFTKQDYDDWYNSWRDENPDMPEWFEKWDQRMRQAMEWQAAVLEARKVLAAEQSSATEDEQKLGDAEQTSDMPELGTKEPVAESRRPGESAPEEDTESLVGKVAGGSAERVARERRSCGDRLLFPLALLVIVVFVVVCVLVALPYLRQIEEMANTTPTSLPTLPVAAVSPTSATTGSTSGVFTSTPAQISTPPTKQAQGVLFEDDFNDGLDRAWEIVRGNWVVANAKLTTASRDKEWSSMVVGDDKWTDYTIDLEVDFNWALGTPANPIEIQVRVQDSDNKMVFAAGNKGYEAKWYAVKDGESTTLYTGKTMSNDPFELRVEVKGDSYVAYVEGEKWLSVYDSTLSHGKVGVAMFCATETNCDTIDNFKVTALE